MNAREYRPPATGAPRGRMEGAPGAIVSRGKPDSRLRLLTISAALIVAFVVLAQGISAPFVKDAEPQSAEYIQSVVDGHWIIPADYYGEPVRKPLLFYWSAAAITAATGGRVDEVRARVLSVASGAAVALEVLAWTAEYVGAETGALAFVFILGSFGFTSRGTLALTDMMLLALIYGAWHLMYRAIEAGSDRRRTIAIGALLGLGILTKGPVAIVIPGFAALIYVVLARKSVFELMRARWAWIALAVAIPIALIWYVPALIRGGSAMERIIVQENAGHFLSRGIGGTGEAARPIYYIAMRMAGAITPLNLMLPALVLVALSGGFDERFRRPILYQMSWLGAVLIFFSAASAKRDDYILAGIPPLAILFGTLFTSIDEGAGGRSAGLAITLRKLACALVAIGMLAGLGALIGWNAAGGATGSLPIRLKPDDQAQLSLFISYFGTPRLGVFIFAAAVVAGAFLVMSGLRKNPLREGLGMGVLSLAGVILVTAAIRPALSEARTLKVAAPEIAQITDGNPVYSLEGRNYELSFYLGRPLPELFIRGKLRPLPQPAFLFGYARSFDRSIPEVRNRCKLLKSWDRIGLERDAELFLIERDLKPAAGRNK